MKYKNIIPIILELLLVLWILGCAGAPKPVVIPDDSSPDVSPQEPAPDPNQQPPGKDILDALQAAMDRAASAESDARGAQGPTYFPEDWETAESKKQTAQNAKKSTLAEAKEAIALYNAAADSYDDIARKSLLAKEQDEALKAAVARAEKARKDAQDVQGPTYFPNDWKAAESKNDTAKNAKRGTADEMKGAATLYADAADSYDDIARKSLLAKEQDEALKAAVARAEKARKDAQDVQGPTYFPNDWKAAESKNDTAKNAKRGTADEMKGAAALYIAAAAAYDDIVRRSGPLLAKEQDEALKAAVARAEKARKDAQDVQGPAYFPNDWKAAESKNDTAKNAKRGTADEMKGAAALYIAAAVAYDDITRKSRPLLDKDRDDALKALNAAIARADTARSQALDAQGPTYFPNDWKAAEVKNQTAKNAKKDTPGEMKNAIALYIAAAESYDDITRKSRPLFSKDQEDALKDLNEAAARADTARQQALDVQGSTYFPNDWKTAESKNQAGKDAKRGAPAEVKAAAALYIAAATTYDEITRKSLARIAKDQEDALKSLNDAMARADTARSQALDAQGPAYFPNDWNTAESKNQTAKDAKKDTVDEMKGAAALYIAAAGAYDDIARKSRPLLAKDRDDTLKALNDAMARADTARSQALDAQGPTYFPNDWKTAESKNQTAKDAKKDTPAEVKSAIALYIAAADTYEDITRKTLSRAAKDQEDALKALQAAMARAETSRKQALDVQSPAYFPDDWKTAESKNQTAKDAKRDTADEVKAATALYIAAAGAYDDLARKSRPLFAKERDDAMKALQAAMAQAETARKQALDVQSPAYFPKDWETAESKNQTAKNAKRDTADEVKAATALYIAAAGAYDDLSRKSRPLFAKERDDAMKALQAAMAQAETARKQALDVQSPAYFPKDWETAESKNQTAKNAKRDTADEVKAALALYSAAADTYTDLARKSRSLFTKEWEETITRERTAAIQAGIRDISPSHLAAADQAADAIRTQFKSNDYIPTGDSLSLPIDMYKALKARADVFKVRQEITERGFADADPANLSRGDEITLAAIKDYEAGNPKTAQDKTNEALMRYNEVLKNGWMAFARDKGLEAGRERQIALDLKANVAVRAEFNGADGIYQQAIAEFNAQAFQNAAELYGQSTPLFIAAGKSAEEKRQLAEQAITAVKQKTAESQALARSVGLTLEGGEQ